MLLWEVSLHHELLYGYCLEKKITFTRSRPYKKNDQAHVEQKNWSVVRRTVTLTGILLTSDTGKNSNEFLKR